MLWEHDLQLFLVLSNSIETLRTCYSILLENTATKKGKHLVNYDYQNVNSLCSSTAHASSVFRVIETRFSTNQHAYFVRTVF